MTGMNDMKTLPALKMSESETTRVSEIEKW